jgi:hypothetical protein
MGSDGKSVRVLSIFSGLSSINTNDINYSKENQYLSSNTRSPPYPVEFVTEGFKQKGKRRGPLSDSSRYSAFFLRNTVGACLRCRATKMKVSYAIRTFIK